MTKKYADIKIWITVSFEDDGENDLKDQALEEVAYTFTSGCYRDATIEVVGPVRDTELPEQP